MRKCAAEEAKCAGAAVLPPKDAQVAVATVGEEAAPEKAPLGESVMEEARGEVGDWPCKEGEGRKRERQGERWGV
jgi:hypothetical protein